MIYVAESQRTEADIIGARSGSAAFDDFALSLGWAIDIAKQSALGGFRGGLDPEAEYTEAVRLTLPRDLVRN